MALKNPSIPNFFFFFVLLSILLVTLQQPGIGATDTDMLHTFDSTMQPKGGMREELKTWKEKSARRLMIGSVAPTCTYNECRGCRFKCRAEQVPVDANDPINSAYRYRCVCHR